MVRSVNGSSHYDPLSGPSTRLDGLAQVSGTEEASKSTPAVKQVAVNANDQAEYDQASLLKALSEQDALKFGRQVTRLPESYDQGKVSQLQQQLSTPDGIADYLGQMDWSQVAGKMLEGSAAGFLTRG